MLLILFTLQRTIIFSILKIIFWKVMNRNSFKEKGTLQLQSQWFYLQVYLSITQLDLLLCITYPEKDSMAYSSKTNCKKAFSTIKQEFIYYQSHHLMNINILLNLLLFTTQMKILDNLDTRTFYLLLTQMLAHVGGRDDYLQFFVESIVLIYPSKPKVFVLYKKKKLKSGLRKTAVLTYTEPLKCQKFSVT